MIDPIEKGSELVEMVKSGNDIQTINSGKLSDIEIIARRERIQEKNLVKFCILKFLKNYYKDLNNILELQKHCW